MKEFLTSLPSTFGGWIVMIGFFVFGAVAIYGLFDKRFKERSKEKTDELDKSEDRLIDVLQKTVTQLETKVNKQTADIEHLTQEVNELKRDNQKYIEIFQGRDSETKKFYESGYAAMKLLNDTHDAVTTMAKSIEDTNKALQALIDLFGKSIDVVGKVATK